MKKLLLATKNPGKIKEFSRLLKDFSVLSLRDLNIENDVDEDGKTFIENSQKKARFYAELSGLPSLSDDGGLEIDALNGEPGVRSRRWLGYEATDEELGVHLEKVIKTLPEDRRAARFVTVVSFALPTGEVWSERGEVVGFLKKDPNIKLIPGYPFRSYFYLPEINKFYKDEDLDSLEIDKYNHRYKALKKLKPLLEKHL